MSSTLDGATDPGYPNAYPADPGEFAARWNEWNDIKRADFLRMTIENAEVASACFTRDHQHEIDVSREARIHDRQTGITMREFARRLDWWELREKHSTIGIAWLRNHFRQMLDRYPIEERTGKSTGDSSSLPLSEGA